MALIETNFDSVEALNKAFSKDVAQRLSQGIQQNGRASLVVSGGRTPAAMFNQLSKQPIDWQNVDITLADERWVDQDDAASNEAMVKRELLINEANRANFYGLKTSASDANNAVEELNQQLEKMRTPFDVLILGMGEDGHTASLFPCSEQIKQGLDTQEPSDYIAVTPTTAPNQRMSLTLKRLLQSKKVFLHLTGEAKKAVLSEALKNDDPLEMPIRAVINQTDVELMWAP
ncbi:6-phosphogluconolactonase [Aliiglaciecola litoralis]|uniref:6-phosphogluconolactonase n=1 Tax=Aliiglaciecola litoralis TaxID=582857 RepID=A0ABN1LCD9_9ALTE